MPFYRTSLGTVHVKGTKLPQPCLCPLGGPGTDGKPARVCGAFPAFLCDWPADGGRTCDANLCEAHVRQVGKNRHYCPAHHLLHLDAQAQADLFISIVES